MNSFPKTSILQKSLWILLLPAIIFGVGCAGSQPDSNSNAQTNANATTANSNNTSASNDDTAALAAQDRVAVQQAVPQSTGGGSVDLF